MHATPVCIAWRLLLSFERFLLVPTPIMQRALFLWQFSVTDVLRRRLPYGRSCLTDLHLLRCSVAFVFDTITLLLCFLLNGLDISNTKLELLRDLTCVCDDRRHRFRLANVCNESRVQKNKTRQLPPDRHSACSVPAAFAFIRHDGTVVTVLGC